jgi:hypothetical protein
VSCRNLLIYLEQVGQKFSRHPLFAQAIGFPPAGVVETVGDDPELFSLVDRKNKIYSKKAVAISYTGFDVNWRAAVPKYVMSGGDSRPSQGLADRQILECMDLRASSSTTCWISCSFAVTLASRSDSGFGEL